MIAGLRGRRVELERMAPPAPPKPSVPASAALLAAFGLLMLTIAGLVAFGDWFTFAAALVLVLAGVVAIARFVARMTSAARDPESNEGEVPPSGAAPIGPAAHGLRPADLQPEVPMQDLLAPRPQLPRRARRRARPPLGLRVGEEPTRTAPGAPRPRNR